MAHKMSTLLFCLLTLASCSFLNVKEVKGPSDDDTFAGMKSLWTRSNLPLVSILVVHGFGHHDPGYSRHLQKRLIKELKMEGTCGKPQEIAGGTYGFIKICEYHDGNQRRLRVYELTWSKLTDELKSQY